jgi:D-glycero-alpha-D-manno-heptose-7-phosphate kinase
VIITRTPVRVSLLGGGTDFAAWSRKHGGIVVGGAVNKYSFVTARFLPPFHDFKTRLVYREIETVNAASELNHKAARAVLEDLGLGDGRLEVFHAADLPGRSGTGSSSTFVVGMLHAVGALSGRLLLPHELASKAIHIERGVLGETGGLQDQAWAAYGGLNVIRFRKDGEIDVRPLPLPADHVRELEEHLLLFFTRVSRTSSEVAATYAPSLVERERDQFAMMRLAEAGAEAIHRKQWETLGNLVDQSWRIKAGLSAAVNPAVVNDLYLRARVAGAWGGKLTGSGGGGCMVLVAPPEKHATIVEALTAQGAVHIPFQFDFGGSQIIFSCPDRSSGSASYDGLR